MERDRAPDSVSLDERLSKLDITIAQGRDAKLCVFTTTEPLFCFEADSEDELSRLVADTLESYVQSFYEIDDFTVEVKKVPLRAPKVPLFPVEPVSKFSVGAFKTGHRELANAW